VKAQARTGNRVFDQHRQVLLADIGLSMLEVPDGDGTPAKIPQSVSAASAEELEAEPTSLAFLAEMAGRGGDLNAAVAFGERAVAAVGDWDYLRPTGS